MFLIWRGGPFASLRFLAVFARNFLANEFRAKTAKISQRRKEGVPPSSFLVPDGDGKLGRWSRGAIAREVFSERS